MSLTPAQALELRRRYRRRRNAGKVIPPVLSATTHKPIGISFPYGIPTNLGSLGRHTGEDHACPVGSLAIAVSWGRVVCVTNAAGTTVSGSPVTSWSTHGDYGRHVVIRQANGLYDVAWCHLFAAHVKPGDLVVPGQVIGLTGATGKVTGPHLHLECRPAGGRFGSDINPLLAKRLPRPFSPAAHRHVDGSAVATARP